MWSLAGISTTTPLTPHALTTLISSGMQRENAKISAFRPRFAMSEIAALSCSETAGMPASMRWIAIAERDVMDLQILLELAVLLRVGQVVPQARVPLVRLPRFLHVSSGQFVG